MKTKTCTKCQETKTLDNFYKLSEKLAIRYAQQDGIDYYCKYCRNGSSLKSHRGGNKKKCTVSGCETHHYAKGMCRKHYARIYRFGTLELKNTPNADVYRFNGKIINTKEYRIKYQYKLDYDEYLSRSANGCEICGDKPDRSLHVDHDHKCCNGIIACGKCVRGIICNKCNKLVDKYETGQMRPDNPHLDTVAKYVYDYHVKRYNQEQHNAIIADNLEEFIAKLDKGNK